MLKVVGHSEQYSLVRHRIVDWFWIGFSVVWLRRAPIQTVSEGPGLEVSRLHVDRSLGSSQLQNSTGMINSSRPTRVLLR
jgi:hypothetical protein